MFQKYDVCVITSFQNHDTVGKEGPSGVMNERLVGKGGGGRSLLRAGKDFKSGGTDTCFLS